MRHRRRCARSHTATHAPLQTTAYSDPPSSFIGPTSCSRGAGAGAVAFEVDISFAAPARFDPPPPPSTRRGTLDGSYYTKQGPAALRRETGSGGGGSGGSRRRRAWSCTLWPAATPRGPVLPDPCFYLKKRKWSRFGAVRWRWR
jgi:hypothetical protein